MKVAFLGLNLKNKYSGGRLHAFYLANAFYANGYEVDYYTNNIPIFKDLFAEFYPETKINWKISKSFLFFISEYSYELIILVPHLASRRSFIFDKFMFYPLAIKLKKKSRSRILLLDFESPNWLKAVGDVSRPLSKYRYLLKVLPFVDIVLSTTKIGMYFAKKYYCQYNAEINYAQLYLSINSKVAETIGFLPKSNSIVVFGRFKEKHKGGNKLKYILDAMPPNMDLIIIGNNKDLKKVERNSINILSYKKNINIIFKSNISEKEKFDVLSRSKLLIFISNFEGYGLPPIEAQFVGTPVLCSSLSVLKEVNQYAYFDDFKNKKRTSQLIREALNTKYSRKDLKCSVEKFSKYENFVTNLKLILKELNV